MAVDESLKFRPVVRRSPSDIAAERTQAQPAGGTAPAAARNDFDDGDEQGPSKKSDPLPQPGEEYRACARFTNRLQAEQRMLHFVLKDGTVEGYSYADLRRVRLVQAEKPGASPVLILRFIESQITDVEIRGRHLKDIHHYISLGVMPWVWEFPGDDFEDENTAVITRISFAPAKG